MKCPACGSNNVETDYDDDYRNEDESYDFVCCVCYDCDHEWDEEVTRGEDK